MINFIHNTPTQSKRSLVFCGGILPLHLFNPKEVDKARNFVCDVKHGTLDTRLELAIVTQSGERTEGKSPLWPDTVEIFGFVFVPEAWEPFPILGRFYVDSNKFAENYRCTSKFGDDDMLGFKFYFKAERISEQRFQRFLDELRKLAAGASRGENNNLDYTPNGCFLDVTVSSTQAEQFLDAFEVLLLKLYARAKHDRTIIE